MSHSWEKGALRQLNDNALAEALASGEDDALDVIIERYAPMVATIARRILKHDAEADDTAQEIFFEVFRNIRKFDVRKGAFAAWLKNLSKRRALDQKKYLDRRGFYSALEVDETVAASSPDRHRPETVRQAQELLAMLEPKDRVFLVMKYVRGHTAREIASLTGNSLFSVQHSLAASRRKLQVFVNGRK